MGNLECAPNLDFGLASFYRSRKRCQFVAGPCIPHKSFVNQVVKTKGYVENVIYCHALRISCFNVHAPFVNESTLIRFYKQLSNAVTMVQKRYGGHVIVAGDFNSRSSVNGVGGAPIPYMKDVGIFATDCTPAAQKKL